MIRAVVFDVGGTMHRGEDDPALKLAFAQDVLKILQEGGIPLDTAPEDLLALLSRTAEAYKAWSEESRRELASVDIWGDWFLAPCHVDKAKLAPLAETLSFLYDHARVRLVQRPHLLETIEALRAKGIKVGVISNIISLSFVPRVLQEYGLTSAMSCVVTSSRHGVRKPDAGIFRIAEAELRLSSDQLAYVGDTISRDVIGARNAGWRLMIQIHNPSSAFRDKGVQSSGYQPDYLIGDLAEIPGIIAKENKALSQEAEHEDEH
ncbi:MAG: HAD family hydrolase [Christensenellales bacterium]